MTEKASMKVKNIFRSLARSNFCHFKILILKFSNSLARSKNWISDYEELQIKLVWPKIKIIPDKILRLQLILALSPTAYTLLIVKFVIQQTKFDYIMQISYHLAIVYLWCYVHNPKEDENVTKYWRIYPLTCPTNCPLFIMHLSLKIMLFCWKKKIEIPELHQKNMACMWIIPTNFHQNPSSGSKEVEHVNVSYWRRDAGQMWFSTFVPSAHTKIKNEFWKHICIKQ